MITRTEHSIGPGKADTKIIAKWVADSSGKENTEKPSVPNSESKPKKCFTEQRKEAVRKKRPKPSSTEEIKLRSGGTGFLYGSMGKA